MATRHADGHMSILLGYADDNFTRKLKPLVNTIELSGLTKKSKITGWRIDADHANAIRKFKELGQPADPTEEQKAAIRAFGALKPEDLGTVDPENPVFELKMENNATLLLEIEAVQ